MNTGLPISGCNTGTFKGSWRQQICTQYLRMVLRLQEVELLLDPVAVFRHREFQLPRLRRWPLLRETSQVSNNQCIPTSAAIHKYQIYRKHKTYKPSLCARYEVIRKLRYSCTHNRQCSSVYRYTARSLYPGRGNPTYPLNESGLAPEPVWAVLGMEKSCLCRLSNPGPFSP